METTTLIERPSDELLLKFTDPAVERFAVIHNVWNYKGDLTETGDQRIRARIGDEAWEHFNWDTVVCNGSLMVVFPKWKHPRGVDRHFGGPSAQHWWAMGMAAERHSETFEAPPRLVKRIPVAQLELMQALPGLEIVHVPKVYFWRHGKTKKRCSEPAPKDCAYFRFNGGKGLVVIEPVMRRKGK